MFITKNNDTDIGNMYNKINTVSLIRYKNSR